MEETFVLVKRIFPLRPHISDDARREFWHRWLVAFFGSRMRAAGRDRAANLVSILCDSGTASMGPRHDLKLPRDPTGPKYGLHPHSELARPRYDIKLPPHFW